ncbi:DUF6318 family protein [Aeromicrobium sp. PE09-221]|uniref:DUF6318 family protein n=1 Tax=Aeromicrobium sp. PE09-221 TaxID=1898043 RepID=UPI0011233477|nr:DUF6318 family protein [Aeromicrobium sp. PE09-221]
MVLPVLAVALMGCSGQPEPSEETVTPTPEITVPAMPELAADDSPAGAEAFARHYIEVLNYSALTGDTAELENLSADDCTGCAKYIELYRSTYQNGGFFTGGEWTVEAVALNSRNSTHEVTADISASAGSSKKSATDTEIENAAYQERVFLEVSRGGDRWIAQRLGRPEE